MERPEQAFGLRRHVRLLKAAGTAAGILLSLSRGSDLVGYLAQSSGRNIGVATNAAYVAGGTVCVPPTDTTSFAV